MMTSWFQAFDNPVLIKEMRVGFREKKVFFALIAWVVIVALVASIATLVSFDSNQSLDRLPEAGQMFMEVLFWVQLVLLAMFSPSLTTSAVSGERERKSFDMLLTTHLSPSELIFGKFGFAASFILLALCATIPLESIVFFLGGVSLASFIYAKLILAAFGFLCALYGLMMSARETRSAYATGQTYLGLVFLCWFGLAVLGGLRYAPDVPLPVYIGACFTLLYLGLFMFWKSVNHLEERARHTKVLLSIGLIFYLVVLALVGFCQATYPWFEDGIWAGAGPLHYFLFGILLNPMRPARKVERRRFEASLLSRPILWTVVLSLGLLVPLIFNDEDRVLAINLYALVSGFCTAWFARGLALGRENRYPQILGASWLLLNVVPAFATIEEFRRSNDWWHPGTISPFAMLVGFLDKSPETVPALALAFYGFLFTVGQFRHMRMAKVERLKKST